MVFHPARSPPTPHPVLHIDVIALPQRLMLLGDVLKDLVVAMRRRPINLVICLLDLTGINDTIIVMMIH